MHQIQLAGKTYEVRFTLPSLIALERHLGEPLLRILSPKDFRLERTVAFVWAAILHTDSALTYDDVLAMVSQEQTRKIVDMGSYLVQAFLEQGGYLSEAIAETNTESGEVQPEPKKKNPVKSGKSGKRGR
jgi:hypothetical protein